MTLSVLLPYRPDRGHRDRAWKWVKRRYRQTLPDAELVLYGDDVDDPELFSHAAAINRCAERATGDMFLVADVDTAFNAGEVLDACESIERDGGWRLPQTYYMLGENLSRHLVRTCDPSVGLTEPDDEACEWVGRAVSWAGLVLVPRHAFETVGGYDERHVGWGADDACFGLALETLYGPLFRWDGAAYHLWHPRGDQEMGWHRNSVAQRALTERYQAAHGDPDAMRALVNEPLAG